MVYNNNMSVRFGIAPGAEISYKDYAAQRNMLLSKNEHGFADKKRSIGDKAKGYDDGSFEFIYPNFKTPYIEGKDIQAYVLKNISDMRAEKLRSDIFSIFQLKLGKIVEKYEFEFDDLEKLFQAYKDAGEEGDKIIPKINDEIDRIISRFLKADQKEKALNMLLTEKRAELYKEQLNPSALGNTTPYPVSQPFYKVREFYEKSELWGIFKQMPKIGLLHMHTSASVSPGWIIDTLVNDADNNYAKYGKSYVCLGEDPKTRGKLTFSKPEHGPYVLISRDLVYASNGGSLGKELIDLLSFSSDRINRINYIWDEFNTIFSKTGELLDNPVFYSDYYTEAFKNLVDDNIEYLELRSGFGKFKSRDETEFLNLLVQAERNALDYAKQKGRQFKLRLILCGNRGKKRRFDVFKKMIKAAKWANTDYKDLIIGFDTVSEEDRGISSRYYAEFIINSQIYKILNFCFHDGETNWDFNSNMIDAFLLSDRRIGHGFGLNIFPQLTDGLAFEQNTPLHTPAADPANLNEYFTALEGMVDNISAEPISDNEKCLRLLNKVTEYMSKSKLQVNSDSKTRGLALEICPISNQMLRYTPDLRLHPANALLHKGIQCVLANDDPQIFGNSGLTYDFISAFLAWDLDIWQIKQLIVNTIIYSAIPRRKDRCANYYDDVITALNRFNVLWHNFLIDQVKDPFTEDDDFGGYRKMINDPNYVLDEDCIAVDDRYLNYIDRAEQ